MVDKYTSPPDPNVRTTRVKRIKGRISRMKYLCHDTIELIITRDNEEQFFHPVAGQFCTLRIPGTELVRAYSLSRDPQRENKNELSFVIRLLPDGEFSQWLISEDRINHAVDVSGPLGTFVLDHTESPIVCVAGGSGMSAMFAILEHAERLQRPSDCYFFYGARSAADLYLQDEIYSIQQRWHADFNFHYYPVLSNESENSDWHGEKGLVGDIALRTLRSETKLTLSDANYYLCGPPQMVSATHSHLLALGVPDESCRFDKFEDAHGPAPTIDNSRCVLCDECLMVKPTAGCIVESTSFDTVLGAPSRVIPLQTSGLYYNALVVDESQCIRCNACINACPHGAISMGATSTPRRLRQAQSHTN